MAKATIARLALMAALIAMLVATGCTVGSDGVSSFTQTASSTDGSEGNAAVPGYDSGVVPWELDAQQVVPVTVAPQPEIVAGYGKVTQSVARIPFVTPEGINAPRSTSELAGSMDYYFSENVSESVVQGSTFDPGTGSPAFACYEIEYKGGLETVGFAWYSIPEAMDAYFVGIGDRVGNMWHWYEGPDDGVLSFDPEQWRVRANLGDTLLVCIVLEDGKPADFWQLKSGVPEIRGTGLEWEDQADIALESVRDASKTASATYPPTVDLRTYLPPIRNQGSMGSCTAFGVTDAAFNIMLQEMYGADGWDNTDTDMMTSPMWAYVRSGISPIGSWSPPCGSSVGRYMSQAFGVLRQIGSASDATVPYYATSNCSTTFPAKADEEAAVLKIDASYYVSGTGAEVVEGIKYLLAEEDRPVVIAMYGLETTFMNYTGGVYHYGGTPGLSGGHAMCIVGYDDSLQAFDVRNSWGTYWGSGGYWWCGYDAVEDLVNEGNRFSAYYMTATYNPAAPAYFLGTTPPTVYDETEPNNLYPQGNPLPQFDFEGYTGRIGDSSDYSDFFQFSFLEGQHTSFVLEYNASQASLALELYNSYGQKIATGSSQYGSSSISGVWSSNGEAYVKVVRTSGACDYTLRGTATQPPAPPTGVSATDGISASVITITWQASANAAFYTLERALSADGPYTDLYTTYSLEYNDVPEDPLATYWYRVSAVNDDGTSVPSAPDSGHLALPVPSGVTATDGTYEDYVRVSWTPVNGATEYLVKRGASPNGPFENLGRTSDDVYDDHKAVPSSIYYYTVCAWFGDNLGPNATPDSGSCGAAFSTDSQPDITINPGPGDDLVTPEGQQENLDPIVIDPGNDPPPVVVQ